MKRLYIYIIISTLCLLQANAQMKAISDLESFKKKIENAAISVNSIESDFTQVMHMDVFDEDIKSEGRFYYKKEDKISLEYSKPSNYLIVINGEKIKIVSEGKKNVINLKSNKVMKEMRSMLAGCMSGNIAQISGYKMEYYEDSKSYLIKVKPTNKTVQEYISGFDIYMDKTDLSVSILRITESGNNYTDYLFRNKKFNTLNDDKKFSVH